MELLPGANEIRCELEVFDADEYSSQLHLFIDDQGTREVVFTVHGYATAGPAAVKSGP